MKLLLPILFVVIGLGAGVFAGMSFKPDPLGDCKALKAEMEESGEETPLTEECEALIAEEEKMMKEAKMAAKEPTSFAELKRQFVVPILRGKEVTSLVVATLALEVTEGDTDSVFGKEPKLRDAFLQVLFVHAHSGGFDGEFTAPEAVADLKARLFEVAEPIVGTTLKDVLITEIVRQDY